jgi:Tol biopolymer transport system component
MSKRFAILVLGVVALAGCNSEASRSVGGGDVLAAAGIPGAVASTALSEQDSTPLVARRVWAGPDVDMLGAPSPDGRQLTFVDWSTGDLAVRDLSTGAVKHLTDKGSWSESEEFAEASVISPDGRRVAYAWYDGLWTYELRIMDIEGSAPRILFRDETLGYLEPYDWSPDGSQLLAFLSGGESTELVLISVSDGSVRVAKSLGWRHPANADFSPDGRFIVYDREVDPDSRDRDVYVISTDGGHEVLLVEDPGVDYVLGWAPDGKHILFASDRTGTLGAWMVPVADGEATGPSKLIRPDIWGLYPIGFARNGSYYHGVSLSTADVHVAALDLDTGELLAAPAPVSDRRFGNRGSPEWSPDGRYLAYFQRGSMGGRIRDHRTTISIRSVENGETRDITLNLENLRMIRWSPDGGHLLFWASDRERRRGLFQVDVQTGEFEASLHLEDGQAAWWAEWSPDGKTIYYRVNEGDEGRIIARHVANGRERVLYRLTLPRGITWSVDTSPDGQQLAWFEYDGEHADSVVIRLMVAPTAGGAPQEVHRHGPDEGFPGSLMWSPDGQKLIYLFFFMDGSPPSVWSLPLRGGAPEKLNLTVQGMSALSLHPDGRRIAIGAGQSEGEIWVMEGFLPGDGRGE